MPVLAGMGTRLTPTAIPAPTLYASGLHQHCFISGRKLSLEVLAQRQTNEFGGYFMSRPEMFSRVAQLVSDGSIEGLSEAQVT